MAAKKQAPEPLVRPAPPKGTTAEALSRARAAADAGHVAGALAGLVDAWRLTPADVLADAIVRLGALFDAGAAPVGGRTAKEREAAFQAAAAENRPERLGRLLAVVTETKGSAETQVRLEALTSRTSDPRLSARIGAMLAAPPYNASVSRTLPFWKYLFAVAATFADPRLLALARELPERWARDESLSALEREALNKRLQKLLPALEALVPTPSPTLTAEESASVEAVLQAATRKAEPAARGRESRARSEAELLQDVYEHPDDDAPRLVYADFLQEKGDPRGELIALQCRRGDEKPTREEARRAKDLIAEHGRRWLGAIEGSVLKSGMVFERGFLAECQSSGLDGSWEWNTVHTLVGAAPNDDAQHVASLRTIEGLRGLGGLAKVTKPLGVTSLHWCGPRLEAGTWSAPKPVFAADEVAHYRNLRCLPNLRRLAIDGWNAWCLLTVDPSLLAWLWQSPASAALEELELRGNLAHLGRWREVAEAHRLRRLQLDARTDSDDGLALALERLTGSTGNTGDSGSLSRLVISGAPRTRPYFNVGSNLDGGTVADVVAALGALPDDALVEAVLAPNRRWKPTRAEEAELAGALKRQRRWNGTLRAASSSSSSSKSG